MLTGPMATTSLGYAAFVVAVAALCYLLPRRAQGVLLLLASYLFCALWSKWFPPVLIAVTALDFAVPYGYARFPRRRRLLLVGGIATHLAILVTLKYGAATAPVFWDWLGLAPGPTLGLAVRLLLPVGLSFYTLQGIGYLVDTYQGQMEPARDVVGFALFMAYFPKLLAGPIERPAAFLKHLDEERTVDNERLMASLTLILTGLARKLAIANPLLAMSPQDVFLQPQDYTPTALATALIAFSFALYNDFAGYSNIAQGVSLFFGIELSRNFRRPMFAASFAAIWNRWHISLSHWLRDYVYFPTTRTLLRHRWGRSVVLGAFLPALLTMLVSGLWHGISLNMIVWGLAMGSLLGAERYFNLRFRRPGNQSRTSRWRWVTPVFVVAVVTLLLVFFRSPMAAVIPYWKGLIGWRPWQWEHWGVPLLVAVSLGLDAVQARHGEATAFGSWPRLARAGVIALTLLAVLLASRGSTEPPFIYQGF